MTLHISPLFAADTGAGGAPTTGGTGSTGGEPGSNAPTPSPTGETPATPSGEAPKFTQADIDRIIKERLAAESSRAERREAEARKKAEDEALAKNAEWQKLAETRGAELTTAQAQAAAATRYAERLNALIESEVKDWPDEVKSLDPGADKLDDRLAWIERSRALAARLKALPTAPTTEAGRGQRPTPTPETGGQSYRFQSPGDVKW